MFIFGKTNIFMHALPYLISALVQGLVNLELCKPCFVLRNGVYIMLQVQ